MKISHKKSFCLLLLLALGIAFYFWTESRMPALDHKAQMGQRASITALAFDTFIDVPSEAAYLQRVVGHSMNWAYTNWKGMSFGLAFAAAILALFKLLSFPAGRTMSLWRQSFFGTLAGAPLGVCANCSTPVAVGLYRGGSPVGLALATLSASPTLNVIVLTMAISLLPLELVLIKYGAVAIYLWLVLPLLLRWVPYRLAQSSVLSDLASETASSCAMSTLNLSAAPSQSWSGALRLAASSYLQALLFIVKVTLPFMLLAGLLGVALAELLPLHLLSRMEVSLWGLMGVALAAAFFPVPMAFDVVVTVGLLALGVPVAYVAVVFFALGIFSIYPALVIARDLSWRLSLALLFAIAALAVGSGMVAQHWVSHAQAEQYRQLDQALQGGDSLVEAEDESTLVAAEDDSANLFIRELAAFCRKDAPEQTLACFANTLQRQAAELRGSFNCDVLDDPALRDYCQGSRHVAETHLQALREKQLTVCEQLPSMAQAHCRYQAAFALAEQERDLAYCLQLSSPAEQGRCQFEALSLASELYDSEPLCRTLAPATQPRCLKQVADIRRMNQHIQTNDVSLCLALPDAQASQYCQGVVMVNLLEQGAAPSVCEAVESSFLAQRCRQFVRFFEAQQATNPALCSALEDAAMRGQCLSDVAVRRFEQHLQTVRFERLADATKRVDSKPVSTVMVAQHSSMPAAGFEPYLNGPDWQLLRRPFMEAAAGQGFKRHAAADFGLAGIQPMQADELFEPFSYGRGIATGELDDNAWPDLALATGEQVNVYQNLGGRFALKQVVQHRREGRLQRPLLVALVDLDNAAGDELVASYYGGDVAIWRNREGRFAAQPDLVLQPPDTQVILAAGFADLDEDGRVDMVLGGWSYGEFRHFNPVASQNYVALNRTSQGSESFRFALQELSGPDGETLSVLLSDLDDDGQVELVVANDREVPDMFYRWQDGTFAPADRDPTLPALSSFNTMSLDSADINNDLALDYFSVDMSFENVPPRHYCAALEARARDNCEILVQEYEAMRRGDVSVCTQQRPARRAHCLAAQVIKLAHDSQQPAYCQTIPSALASARVFCERGAVALPPAPAFDFRPFVPGQPKNVLALRDPETGRYHSVAEAFGVAHSRWSWNARFADLDNDGWLDLYVGNGYLFGTQGRDIHSNLFFHNQQGQRFEERTSRFGLEEYLNVPSFVYLDFDQDGDLDLVVMRVAAEPIVLVNHAAAAALQIGLEDRRGVRRATGAQVRLFAGELRQLRELKQSGGYLSQQAPLAHFGLGEYDAAERLQVRWRDGTQTELTQPLPAGYHYRLIRQ